MAATSYQSIKTMSEDFKTSLSNLEYPYPFDRTNASMVVLVDLQNDLADILQANPAKLALIVGLHHNVPTIGILGVTSGDEVLPEHVNGTLDGQQTWPEGSVIKYDDNTNYNNFFV